MKPAPALDEIKDKKWTYANTSTCYYFIKDDDNEKKYEELFLNEEPEEWEKETYYTYKRIEMNKNLIKIFYFKCQ